MSEFGTEPYKLHRVADPGTSQDAAYSVDTTHLEQLVYETIKSIDHSTGAIQDDVLRMFPGKPYSSVTARFKGLLDKHKIYYLGDKRKGRSGRQQRIIRVERRIAARNTDNVTDQMGIFDGH